MLKKGGQRLGYRVNVMEGMATKKCGGIGQTKPTKKSFSSPRHFNSPFQVYSNSKTEEMNAGDKCRKGPQRLKKDGRNDGVARQRNSKKGPPIHQFTNTRASYAVLWVGISYKSRRLTAATTVGNGCGTVRKHCHNDNEIS